MSDCLFNGVSIMMFMITLHKLHWQKQNTCYCTVCFDCEMSLGIIQNKNFSPEMCIQLSINLYFQADRTVLSEMERSGWIYALSTSLREPYQY